jgi:ABC-type transport system involved in multi-copper enzyme maturation permease subunit
MFTTAVASERKTGTIRVTLAKPVPRWAYVVGKAAGAAAVVAAYYTVASGAFAVLAILYGMPVTTLLLWVPWLGLCGALVVGCVGLVVSLFVPAAIAGVLAWFISAETFAWVPQLSHVLPTYRPFNVMRVAMLASSMRAESMALTTLYAVDVVSILLLLAVLRFRRMEIG